MSISAVEVSVRGVRSPALTAGPPDGAEAVVFVHDNPGPADDWRDLLPRAGELGRAIAPDMPGYGRAGKPNTSATRWTATPDTWRRCSISSRITRAHIVAHNFGGPWALARAARHPGALASATLINTGVAIDYRWHRYAHIWRTPVPGEVFQATASRPGFRMLPGRENPRLTREQIDRIDDVSRSWATKRAVLKLYRATPAATLAPPGARRWPAPRWSSGGPGTHTCPANRPSASASTFPSPKSNCSRAMATG